LTIRGNPDGKEHVEFYRYEDAEAAARLHQDKKPLNNPRILPAAELEKIPSSNRDRFTRTRIYQPRDLGITVLTQDKSSEANEKVERLEE
jgi:hypothetical protein